MKKTLPGTSVELTSVYTHPSYNECTKLETNRVCELAELAKAYDALHKCAASGADTGCATVRGKNVDYNIVWNNAVRRYNMTIMHVDSI